MKFVIMSIHKYDSPSKTLWIVWNVDASCGTRDSHDAECFFERKDQGIARDNHDLCEVHCKNCVQEEDCSMGAGIAAIFVL